MLPHPVPQHHPVWPIRLRPAGAVIAGVLFLAGLALAGCTGSTSPTNVSDRTIPPTTNEPGAQPTRTLPPDSAAGPRATVPPASRATIDAFDIPTKVGCDPGADLTVDAEYRTTNADHVVFLVNGTPTRATPPPSGTFAIPLHCDGSVTTVVLTAVDDQGQTTVSAKAILTNAPANGD